MNRINSCAHSLFNEDDSLPKQSKFTFQRSMQFKQNLYRCMSVETEIISRGKRAPIPVGLAVQSAEGKFTTLFTTYPRLHTQSGVYEEALFFLAPSPTPPDKKTYPVPL